ncbi:MAG TPA: IclR family transcriptional regulator [Rhodocyclaceae bacterium]|nr:IclR family transcriptional regulator [Rhodocyclaceae bacterium]
MSTQRYRNEAQQRILKVMLLLAGNEFNGLAPSDLAKAVDTNPSNITRDLANLQEAGLAEPLADTGRWRLGPKVVHIAVAFSRQLDRARIRLDEVTNRYTREP